ncbi:hypothetical protein FACS189485_09410 [Spirochaetia bacterium]|nr:hypothetical protein FACS189485_09410 [Spirochaetia bacterium]
MKTVKVLAICVLAVGANFLLSYLSVKILHLSLFLDTVFTCAVAFAAGTLPGLFTAILTTLIGSLLLGYPSVWDNLFALCAIAEVLLIGGFRFLLSRRENSGLADERPTLISTASALLLLYISTCMIVSLLGGLIDFTITVGLETADNAVHPHTFFKLGLMRNRLPLLAADILSRIPVNIVDRFITAFGGYGLGMLAIRLRLIA